jgi:hypothetical protein
MQHSGSVRYYAERATVRYDMVPPPALDTVVADLRQLGYHPYILLEAWEEEGFRRVFQGQSRLAALDWPPVAALDAATIVRIYDTAIDTDAGQAPPTEIFR